MARDPLAVLWRLRDAAVTEASRDLAAARAREVLEAGRLDAQQQTIRREQFAAVDAEVAAFAAWLPFARRTEEQARVTLHTAQAQVAQQQQILIGRRTEAEAVAKALQRQRAAAALVQARKEQAVMDEAAGRTGKIFVS